MLPTEVLAAASLALLLCLAAGGCGDATHDGAAAPAQARGGPADAGNAAPGTPEYFEGAVGGQIGAPTGLPEDLPLYPGARPTGRVKSPQHGALWMFSSADDPGRVLDHVRRAWTSEGWSVSAELDVDGEQLVAFVKDGRRASVAVRETNGGSRISVAASRASLAGESPTP